MTSFRIIDLISDDDEYYDHELASLLWERIRFEDEEDNGYCLRDLSDRQLGALVDEIASHAGDYGFIVESNGSYWSDDKGYVPAKQ